MIDQLIQNFNWPTFLIALGFFVLVSNLWNLLWAVIQKKRADNAVRIVEKKYDELCEQLKTKRHELEALIGNKEKK